MRRGFYKKVLQELAAHELNLLPAAVNISTHKVSKYKSASGTVYYIKFSAGHYQDKIAHNLHPIIELMAYRIYELYGLNVPEDMFLVLNKADDMLGLASQEILGRSTVIDDLLGQKDAEAMFLPSVLMANYDVTGTYPIGANIIKSPDKGLYVMDPGASMHFRAQGKEKEFGPEPYELDTMRDPQYPAGEVFGDLTDEDLAGDLKNQFEAVSIGEIIGAIDETVMEAKTKLAKFKNKEEASQIQSKLASDTAMIKQNITKRHTSMLSSLRNF